MDGLAALLATQGVMGIVTAIVTFFLYRCHERSDALQRDYMQHLQEDIRISKAVKEEVVDA